MVARRRSPLRGIILAAVLVMPLGLDAQEGPAPSPSPPGAGAGQADRALLMVGLEVGEGIGEAEAYRGSLYAALLTEPGLGGILPEPRGLGGSEAAKAAEAAGCRFLLELRLEPSKEGVSASWTLVDSAEGRSREGPGFDKELPGRASLASAFWAELLVDLEKGLAEPRQPLLLEVLGPPGTVFDGAGPRRRLPESGRLLLRFDVPVELSWTARIPGEYPQRGSLALAPGSRTLRLAPRRFALELGLLNLSFPDFGLRYRLTSHWELRGDLQQYYLGLHLEQGSGNGAPALYTSLPLLVPSLGASYSPFPPDRDWRPRAGADLFTRVVYLPGPGLFVDPLAPLGLRLRLGFDWGLGRGLRFLAEFGADLYPWTDPELFLASGGTQGDRGLLVGGGLFPGHPGWALELPIGALGLRIGL